MTETIFTFAIILGVFTVIVVLGVWALNHLMDDDPKK